MKLQIPALVITEKLSLIRVTYIVSLIAIYISYFYPNISLITIDNDYFPVFIPTTYFLPSLILGLLFFIVSLYFLFKLPIRYTIISGLVGIFIHSTNYIYFFINYNINKTQFGNSGFVFNIWAYVSLVAYIITIFLISLLYREFYVSKNKDKSPIKKKVLELGIMYPRLEIREISEKCNGFPDVVINIVKEMIDNGEIYAEYFKNSKSITFNKLANINEMDGLSES
ncbi:MAG: hypothetical protein GF311_17710 [Candidatus Lokiarchaeota archaeon]|nr:hypothetical protein [Candidatus Lokiarchaeota archaeon]